MSGFTSLFCPVSWSQECLASLMSWGTTWKIGVKLITPACSTRQPHLSYFTISPWNLQRDIGRLIYYFLLGRPSIIIEAINSSLAKITRISDDINTSDSDVLISKRKLILHHAETLIETKSSLTSASLIFALLSKESMLIAHLWLIDKNGLPARE